MKPPGIVAEDCCELKTVFRIFRVCPQKGFGNLKGSSQFLSVRFRRKRLESPYRFEAIAGFFGIGKAAYDLSGNFIGFTVFSLFAQGFGKLI